MELDPYKPSDLQDGIAAPTRGENADAARPRWMTAMSVVCWLVLFFCGFAIAASIYEILLTRSHPPDSPFAPDFSNSIFGNRAMEREIIEMLIISLPFIAGLAVLRWKRRRQNAGPN